MSRQRPTRNFGRWSTGAGNVDMAGHERPYVILKQNFGWAGYMWAGRPRIDRIAIREAQNQLKMNRCRNKKVIVGQFWVSVAYLGGALWLVMLTWMVEIDRVQSYVKTKKIGLAWSMWAGHSRIDRIVIKDIQY
ncbi:hypothetical protein DPMN_140038 [Dreissena polymorpha]|uniref:Uncharacterized protein n=1 Tax=Dreissena polymorpha TaxID=45954 RepID=A0A9D4JGA2_DREPO|nr:hypothetical protein DPMN_140038 [Dreissena polymorpha]